MQSQFHSKINFFIKRNPVDNATPSRFLKLADGNRLGGMALSKNGQYLAASSFESGNVYVWDVHSQDPEHFYEYTRNQLNQLSKSNYPYNELLFLPDDQLIVRDVYTLSRHTLQSSNVENQDSGVNQLDAFFPFRNTMCVLPNNLLAMIAYHKGYFSNKYQINIIHPDTNKIEKTLAHDKVNFMQVISSDRLVTISSHNNLIIKFWDLKTYKQLGKDFKIEFNMSNRKVMLAEIETNKLLLNFLRPESNMARILYHSVHIKRDAAIILDINTDKNILSVDGMITTKFAKAFPINGALLVDCKQINEKYFLKFYLRQLHTLNVQETYSVEVSSPAEFFIKHEDNFIVGFKDGTIAINRINTFKPMLNFSDVDIEFAYQNFPASKIL